MYIVYSYSIHVYRYYLRTNLSKFETDCVLRSRDKMLLVRIMKIDKLKLPVVIIGISEVLRN